MRRRQLLALVPAVGAAGTAGCLGSSSGPGGGTTLSPASSDVGDGDGDDGDGDGGDDGSSLTAGPAPLDLIDGKTYYVGQTLEREAGVDAGETLDLRQRGEGSVSLVFADDQGTVRLDTRDRNPGRYELLDSGGGTVATFRLVRQDYAVSVDPATVSTGGADTQTSVEITSNRRGYRHVISMTRDGDALDAGSIDAVLGADGTRLDLDEDGTDETLVLDGGGTSQTLVADFGGTDPGSYALYFDVPDTTAAATATVTVADSAPGQASLATRVLTGPRGEVISIPVTLTNTDTATVRLGSRDLDYLVTATVEDGDGDGAVTVRWDTGVAGQTDDEADAWSAAANTDAVTDVSRSTGQLGGPLALEPYPISLRVDGTETEVGVATVREPPTTTPPPTTGVIIDREDFPLEEGIAAAKFDFTVPERAAVAVTFGTVTDDPMAFYVMPESAEENYWNGSEFEYVDEISFPLTHSGSAQTELAPGRYLLIVAYPDRQGYVEGTEPAVVDLLVEYV